MRQGRLLLAGTGVAFALVTSAAQAQSAADEGVPPIASVNEDDEIADGVIVVTGVRAAIQSANQVKRNAEAVVDVITAEDIGQLPDLSVAESLERLPGVTSNEDRGRATQLIVRGLSADFTQTTLNGRELASGGNGREVTLGLYPAELITQAVVAKSPVASMVEGGIAGQIDLQTLRPLDRRGRVISANLRGIYRNNAAEVEGVDNPGWRGSIALADKFADDRIGLAFGVSYIDQPLITDDILNAQPPLPNANFDIDRGGRRGGFGDIDGDGSIDFVPQVVRFDAEGGNQKRLGVVGAIQFRPVPTFEINVDALYSDSQQDFIQSSLIVPFTNNLRFTNVVTSDAGVGDTVTQGGTPVATSLLTAAEIANQRFNIETFYRSLNEETISGGFNARHDDGVWAAALDVGYSRALASRPAVGNVFRRIGFTGFYDANNGQVPDYTFSIDPAAEPVSANVNQGFQAQSLNIVNSRLEDQIFSLNVDVGREFRGGFITGVSAGLRYVDREKVQTRDVDIYNIPLLQAAFAPGLPGGAANGVVADAAAAAVVPFPFSNLYDNTSANVPRSWLFVDPILFRDAAATLTPLGRDARDFIQETYDVRENSMAGYVRADFAAFPGGRALRGNIGLRVVQTDSDTRRVEPAFTVVRGPDGNIQQVTVADLNEDTVQFSTIPNSYTNILPSLNVVYEVADDFLVRFAAARSISRPVFSLVGETLQLNSLEIDPNTPSGEVIQPTGVSGNPLLEPFESDQADLSLEWYPSLDLSIAVGAFYKNISNFVSNQSVLQQISTASGGSAAFIINQPVNEPGAQDFYGIEANYQHAFTFLPAPFDGLGVQLNYTWLGTTLTNEVDFALGTEATSNQAAALCAAGGAVDTVICSTVVQNPNNFSEHSVNGVIFYEKGPFSLRFAGRYKSDYPRQGDGLDQYRVQDDEFFLDASIGLDLNRNIRLIGAVTNLTNEPARTYFTDPYDGANQSQLNRYTEFGTTYTLGVRVRL